jgi:hypothetical protein
MGRWLRRLRGIVVTGVIWGVLGMVLGSVAGAVGGFLLGGGFSFASVLNMAGGLGLFGLIGGSGFAMLLTAMEGRKSLEELSALRSALWGAAAGAVFPFLFILLRDGSLIGVVLERLLMGSAFFGAVGGALAAGTVLAAKGAGGELSAGSRLDRLEPPDSS